MIAPIHEPVIESRHTLSATDDRVGLQLLRLFFIKFYDLAGCSRADVTDDQGGRARLAPTTIAQLSS